ncbi:MAG: MarR family transcriptional regulator [Polyangiales bacterium]|jgi:DNA-binding MarR family transcriptional regulator
MTKASSPLNCACFNTRKTARVLGQVYDRALEPSGLKNTQFTALAVADAYDGISITELSKAMEIERTTLTRNLKLLERDGLVKVGPGADGRSKTVVLTAKGKRRLGAALPLWQNAHERMLREFGANRWKSLHKELDAMRTSLHR